MMQPCSRCKEWAQWRMRKPVFDDKGKLASWELIAFLCGQHKVEQETILENKAMRFDFTGAIPCH